MQACVRVSRRGTSGGGIGFYIAVKLKRKKNEEDLDFQDILLNEQKKYKGIHTLCHLLCKSKGGIKYTRLLIFAKNTGKIKAEMEVGSLRRVSRNRVGW